MRTAYGYGALLAALLLMAAAAHGADGALRGRASLGGVLVETVEVRAYAHRPGTFGPWTGEPVAGRTATATDGTYVIDLPPGRYVVEAIKKRNGNSAPTPEPGDYYCLYSGSPVTVAAGQSTNVGLYLVEVAPEQRTPAEGGRITGSLTFQGEKVERAYLYAYPDAGSEFRGPADLLQPVAKGDFSVRLPPGAYYLVARKRVSRGGPYGPIAVGDLFNFYPLNPVTLNADETLTIRLPLIERLSQLEEGEGDYRGVEVTVIDGAAQPAAGRYILAYDRASRVGPPVVSAGPTGPDGKAVLNAPPAARYLRVRENVGGPAMAGETYADAELPEAGIDAATSRRLTVTVPGGE